ncbi:MAG: universal stress protein [Meiothermus sp.]|nr:universal stress protein [Meiothermus sp.]
MFRKILIAVDESSCSERAGRVGLAFAKKLGAQVLVTHVLKAPPAYWGLVVPSETIKRRAEEILAPWAELGRQMQLDLRTEPMHDDDIAEGIVYLANRSQCDLIVMGTHGREGLGRMLLGSVAERVSRLAKMPVMLVRGDGQVEPSTGLFERILAPVDGSEAGRPAFKMADQLATILDAELQILHVVPPLPAPMVGPYVGNMTAFNWEDTLRAMEEQGEAIVENARKLAKAPRIKTALLKAQTRREADVIVDFARDSRADLIVMGTHGRTGLERLLLGSVAEGVAHHAPVPLLLVRPVPAASDVSQAEAETAHA